LVVRPAKTSCPFPARLIPEGKQGQGSALDPPRAEPLEPACRYLPAFGLSFLFPMTRGALKG
jgi:hypothetical protein